MIKEEYITEETAKFLFECGCKDARECWGRQEYGSRNRQVQYNYKDVLTQAQAMRWLRDEKNYYVYITRVNYAEVQKGYYVIIHPKTSEILRYETYEEAAEHGIQEACSFLLKGKTKG